MKSGDWFFPISLYLVSFLLLVLSFFNVTSPITNVTGVLTMPLNFSVHSFRNVIEEQFAILVFWRSGEKRISELEQRNAELLAQVSEINSLRQENSLLRDQLGVGSSLNFKVFPVLVVGTGHNLMIGAGSDLGIKEGQTVIVKNNLVGRVVRVAGKTSLIQIPNDGNSRIPCKVRQARCVVLGQFNSSLVLDRVAQNEEIAENDVVVTSGQDGNFPPNLVIGRVKKILSKETDLFIQAEVEPALDFQKLDTVFVVQ